MNKIRDFLQVFGFVSGGSDGILNPCYVRERDRLVRNVLKQRSTDGSQMRFQ
jgi:hypothetical protein